MKIIEGIYNPDPKRIDFLSDSFLDELGECIQGDPIDFLKTQKLRPDIESLPHSGKMEFLYSALSRYTDSVAPESVCEHGEMKFPSGGCKSSLCCKLRPDVFLYEKEILDTLPSSPNRNEEFCRFFDIHEHKCSIYQNRPFACRMFFNFENDSHYCTEACRDTKSLKNAVYMYIKPFLGEYIGPYIST